MDKLNDQMIESSLEPESIIIDSMVSERDLSSYTRKRHGKEAPSDSAIDSDTKRPAVTVEEKRRSWRRILLLIVAITVHNIPGMFTRAKVSESASLYVCQ